VLKTFLESQPFASEIKLEPIQDHGISGNFEVTIVETNQLIHSAKRGMGHAMTSRDMNAIGVHVEDALEAMKA